MSSVSESESPRFQTLIKTIKIVLERMWDLRDSNKYHIVCVYSLLKITIHGWYGGIMKIHQRLLLHILIWRQDGQFFFFLSPSGIRAADLLSGKPERRPLCYATPLSGNYLFCHKASCLDPFLLFVWRHNCTDTFTILTVKVFEWTQEFPGWETLAKMITKERGVARHLENLLK